MNRVASVLVLALAVTVAARGGAIVQYTAPGGSLAPTTTIASIAAGNLNDTGSNAVLAAGFTFPDTVYLDESTSIPDAAAAYANQQFFQFTITPNAGFLLMLSSLTFDAARGGTATPRGWALRSSVDGYASEIATQAVPTVYPATSPFSVDLSAPAFQGLTGATTFRLYQYSPGFGSGVFYDNLTLNGTVSGSGVPEPGAWVLMAFGLLGVAGLTRRKPGSCESHH